MESLDFKTFLSSTHPFEVLNKTEFNRVIDNLDIEYFKKNENIISKNSMLEFCYIIAKGVVKESNEKNEEHFYAIRDLFDFNALVNQKSKSEFTAIEESIIFTIPKDIFLETLKNRKFEEYFSQDTVSKIDNLLKKDVKKELSTFMIAKIEDSYIHPAIFVYEDESIFSTVELMSQKRTSSIFINYKNGEVGIVTDSNLRERVILKRVNYEEKISTIASKGLISIDKSDFLYNALLLMTEHSLKRLVVKENGKIVGTIEQVDLLSAFSHKSHLIAVKIKKAKNIDDIKNVTKDLIHVLTSLQDRGVKVRHITKLVSQLNSKIYKKIYELIFPKEIIKNSALIILGSEGRDEQTLKTDQDNSIILRDEFKYDGLEKFTDKFTKALIECGFPECKGGVMVNNTYWTKSLKAHKNDFFKIIDNPTQENLLNLAILLDAKFVVGDNYLFLNLRDTIFNAIEAHPTLLANFAKNTLMFETPLTFFKNFALSKGLHKDELDIKKGAIFSIVHGIRSLSLEYKIEKTNTIERIKELNNLNIINREFANELIEAFNFLLTLRLKIQLEKEQKEIAINNYINPKNLTKIERDLLIDVLKLNNKFKKFISYHFKLSIV